MFCLLFFAAPTLASSKQTKICFVFVFCCRVCLDSPSKKTTTTAVTSRYCLCNTPRCFSSTVRKVWAGLQAVSLIFFFFFFFF